MFKLSAVFLLTLVITGCQPTSRFKLLPEREEYKADNGVVMGIRFNYQNTSEPGITRTGITAYCANGFISDTPMSTNPLLKLPEPGFLTNQAEAGRPVSMTYFTVSYPDVLKVLVEVCKATEEDQD
ncbi:hypothetical protein [Nostoc sp. JL33]|uniref:hypothetical protein n=1 Tax=Nostoc sp. JL33 TaxID=2815396 RepID=UPI0025DC30AC|nr:hypothetical protein [Nostoc sp. JL33]MBN3872298.1 hypothetical protein [Nostoc sp. JL33]